MKREGKGDVELSSTVSGDAAIDYRQPEISGQNIPMLNSNNDFLVPDITLSGKDGESEKVKLKLFAIRIRAGGNPLMARVRNCAEKGNSSTISVTLDELKKGSDGIGFLLNQPLYEKTATEQE